MKRRTLTTATAAVTTLLLAGSAAAAGGGVGSAGIGDPYYPEYGNGGYDVRHYGINVTYDPTADSITGRTTVRARTTERLKQFNLDLVLPASEVLVDGRPAAFTQTEHELVVTPRRPLASGELMEVRVTYAGRPADYRSLGIKPWITTGDGAAAVGEPEIAAWWFPSNDHPRDKARFDVKVSVPADVEALGNGDLVSSKQSGGQRTWHWRENDPMATYLAFFVAGQFDITKSRTASGIPVITAVASDGGSEGDVRRRRPRPHPRGARLGGPSVGSVPVRRDGWRGPGRRLRLRAGEPDPTRLHPRVLAQRRRTSTSSSTSRPTSGTATRCRSENWRDIWLNEGFASFTEWLWSEKHDEGTAAEIFDEVYNDIPADDAFWDLTIGDPGKGREFAGAVYDRGAMTLQALRTRIGGPAFFDVMRTWARTHRYGNGSIPQFIRLAERISGQRLDGFFDVWLYTGAKPEPTRANGFPRDFATRTPRPARPRRVGRRSRR